MGNCRMGAASLGRLLGWTWVEPRARPGRASSFRARPSTDLYGRTVSGDGQEFAVCP